MSESESNIPIPEKLPKKMPWFMPFVCEGCGDCIEACPKGGIKLVCLDRKVPPAWLVEPDECIGCGKCVQACQCSAVQMTAYAEKAYIRYKTKKTPY